MEWGKTKVSNLDKGDIEAKGKMDSYKTISLETKIAFASKSKTF